MRKILVVSGLIVSFFMLGLGIYGMIEDNASNSSITKEENVSLDTLKESLQKLKTVKSLTYEMQLQTNKESENSNALIKLNLDTEECEMKMSIGGQKIMHSYSIIENGSLVDYMTAPGLGMNEWYISSGDTSSFNYDNSYLDIFLEHMNNFRLENNIFKLTLPKEKARMLLNIISVEDKNIIEEDTQIIGDILVTIKLNGNRDVASITYDFSHSIQTGEEIYTKYVLTESYYSLGTSEIVVPEDVKNSAVSFGDLSQ